MMQQVFEVRLAMATNGFIPIPVIGKVPPLSEWQKTREVSQATLEEWSRVYPGATNTGIVTRNAPVLDLDLLDEAAVAAAIDMVRQRFGDRGRILIRTGRAPRCAIPFRTSHPFKKLLTKFVAPAGVEPDKIELLCNGQQLVAHGVHPDTLGAYTWSDGDPTNVAHADLPKIDSEEASRLVADIVAMLETDFGYTADRGRLTRRKQAVRAAPAPKNATRDRAWASRALEEECARVADAAIGERNSQLNKSAFNVFQIVHGDPNLLDENEVRERLFAAATACGLVQDDGADSVWRTIESGEAGAEKQPRVRPLARMERPASGANGGLGLADASLGAGPADYRTLIRYTAGNLHRATDAAEEALANEAWAEIYQRGGMLVRPVLEEMAAAHDRTTSIWRLIEVHPDYMAEMLGWVARFEAFDKRSDDWTQRNVPKDVVNMLMARRGHWQAPIALGIVHTPQFRRDGTLTMKEGYDPETRLVFKGEGETFPPVPERPTREEALAALEVLKEAIRHFPFKSEADRAVVLSMFLTGLCRRTLDAAPLHAMSATAAGTGKSMLVDLASLLASGREAPVISIDCSDEEVQKRVGASLLAGNPIVALDNCAKPIGNTLICLALTQRWVQVRVLGRSRNADAPGSALLTATGNGLTVAGDLTRRTIRSELDARCARPELREFDFDPKEVFQRRRGELVSAALTVIRAGRVAELRPISPPLGSFGMWSAWIRNTLQWLGCADPCTTMEKIYADDPVRELLGTVIVMWRDHLGVGSEFYPQQLIDRAGLLAQELRDALLAVARAPGGGNNVSSKNLGVWLKKVDCAPYQDASGQTLRIRETRHYAGHRWHVLEVVPK